MLSRHLRLAQRVFTPASLGTIAGSRGISLVVAGRFLDSLRLLGMTVLGGACDDAGEEFL